MTETKQTDTVRPRNAPRGKRPVWPWLLVLLLTLVAIYSYDRITTMANNLIRDMPPEFFDMLGWFIAIVRSQG